MNLNAKRKNNPGEKAMEHPTKMPMDKNENTVEIVCLTRAQIEEISTLLWVMSNQIEEILSAPIWEYDLDHL
jgi:hypothetical protein